MIRVAILTVSDSLSRGERKEDGSGDAIERFCKERGWKVVVRDVCPDNIPSIKGKLLLWCDSGEVDLIVTTGGTGFSPRDVTPEATKAVIEREAPGFSEIIRMKSYEITPFGIISRGVSGIRGSTLIVNLPGSSKAVSESLSFIADAIPHAVEKLKGDETPCGG